MKSRCANRGFTLVELLVALFVMALLAILSWRGLDGMTRAQERTEARANELLALQVGLAQWAADLENVVELPQTPTLDWNGRVLRVARRSTSAPTDGIMVVGWTRRDVNGAGTWLRWQSPPVTTRSELDEAWRRADAWSQTASAEERSREVAIAPLVDWQIFYYRADAWSNPLSSGATTVVPTTARGSALPLNTSSVPDGVRLVLSLPAGHAISGQLTRDWAKPTLAGNKS
jgi:general secretion pathway protein J